MFRVASMTVKDENRHVNLLLENGDRIDFQIVFNHNEQSVLIDIHEDVGPDDPNDASARIPFDILKRIVDTLSAATDPFSQNGKQPETQQATKSHMTLMCPNSNQGLFQVMQDLDNPNTVKLVVVEESKVNEHGEESDDPPKVASIEMTTNRWKDFLAIMSRKI